MVGVGGLDSHGFFPPETQILESEDFSDGKSKLAAWWFQDICYMMLYVLILCMNLISLIQCIIGVCFALLGLFLP